MMNFRQKVGVAVLDVAVLVELAVSIYFANQNPGDFASVFFLMFFSLLIPTLIVARFVIKGLRSKEPDIEPSN
jgi:ethanolamine transporter EutH